MKLTQVENVAVDLKTGLIIRQEVKDAILVDIADKGILADYSSLENNNSNLLEEASDVSKFFNDAEIEL